MEKREGFNLLGAGWYVPGLGDEWKKDWLYSREKLIELLSEKPEINKVFIFYMGMRYITGLTNDGHGQICKDSCAPIGLEKFAAETQKFINELHSMGKKVYFVAENPILNTHPLDAIERGQTSIKIISNYETTTRTKTIEYQNPYLEILKKLKNCTVIYTIDKFCEGGICRQFDEDGVPFYYDSNQLSPNGSQWQAENILKPFLLEK